MNPLAGEVRYDAIVGLIERLPPLIQEAGAEIDRMLAAEETSGAARAVLDELVSQLRGAVPSAAAILAVPLTVLGVIGNLALALTISAFAIGERRAARRLVERIAEPGRAELLLGLVSDARLALATFIRAQILLMASVALGTFVGMLVLGVPFALPLAVLAFLAQAIPFVGPYLFGVPIVAIAFAQSPTTGLLMLAWIVVIQQYYFR